MQNRQSVVESPSSTLALRWKLETAEQVVESTPHKSWLNRKDERGHDKRVELAPPPISSQQQKEKRMQNRQSAVESSSSTLALRWKTGNSRSSGGEHTTPTLQTIQTIAKGSRTLTTQACECSTALSTTRLVQTHRANRKTRAKRQRPERSRDSPKIHVRIF